MTQQFKPGELVWIALTQQANLYNHDGLLGIVCRPSRNHHQRFLVHLQSGSKHWFFDDEIRKATDDDTI